MPTVRNAGGYLYFIPDICGRKAGRVASQAVADTQLGATTSLPGRSLPPPAKDDEVAARDHGRARMSPADRCRTSSGSAGMLGARHEWEGQCSTRGASRRSQGGGPGRSLRPRHLPTTRRPKAECASIERQRVPARNSATLL